ncbi:hypothetical protein K6119_11795 [Paracrocinitomix mangrovi]|uniref:hypothetical protein n=1 Tax=Paracrocinitomix mangrovi TaxID=2862509 RepID=UPI001C8D4E61|nr:hypothetical protein [Paracrocinitomix mangrovi]UKN00416.1 hypothetical protein K6119_11795 [Paracrocinitomix mangrovi]
MSTQLKIHLAIGFLAFITAAISGYFGVSINNANENVNIQYLNEFDDIHYYDIVNVPKLTFTAAVVTLPLMMAILVLELLSIKKASIKKTRNMAMGLSVAALIVLVVDFLTLMNPENYDFSKWGYLWIAMSFFILVGNMLSFVMLRFGRNQ